MLGRATRYERDKIPKRRMLASNSNDARRHGDSSVVTSLVDGDRVARTQSREYINFMTLYTKGIQTRLSPPRVQWMGLLESFAPA